MGVTHLALDGEYFLGPEEALARQEARLQGCRRCKLCQGRTTVVFGSGSARADFVCIGEGPGADEDAQGKPFVGRAGQLLTKMLEAIKLSRDEVYICNTVKCFISPRVLIYTADGYRPIKDIEVGDLVLTHRGRFRPVVYVRPREVLPGGSEVIRLSIQSEDGNRRPVRMTVTPEHPFLVNGVWKAAREIKKGDSIATLADRCEVCGRTFFVRYDRYDARTYRTCSARCHNKRVFHSPDARDKVRRTMRAQYADGRRDANTIALRANDKTRQLVAAGQAKIQRLTTAERQRSRIALAAKITAGVRRGMTGFGEATLKTVLDRLGVEYVHLFALPNSAWLFDFCLPTDKILIEVRGPGFGPGGEQRALEKEQLARDHGYLVVNLWWLQIETFPDAVEELLRRVLKTHRGEYVFMDATVIDVESRQTRRDFPLYNIGVEDDESYIAAGVVSHNCRPPGNRNPEADELATCAPFLQAQLGVIQPKVILSLGSVATQALLGTREPIGKLRGRVHPFGNAVLIPTFHPAFLLRNPGPEYKRMAYEDLKLARREYDARRTR
ncbi:MAG: Hint domain-containing protein [Candidatus Rokubacteria bacterium]|nr:Hint domain-containing protein [Candidatus Rokubacteria bacterium]